MLNVRVPGSLPKAQLVCIHTDILCMENGILAGFFLAFVISQCFTGVAENLRDIFATLSIYCSILKGCLKQQSSIF